VDGDAISAAAARAARVGLPLFRLVKVVEFLLGIISCNCKKNFLSARCVWGGIFRFGLEIK